MKNRRNETGKDTDEHTVNKWPLDRRGVAGGRSGTGPMIIQKGRQQTDQKEGRHSEGNEAIKKTLCFNDREVNGCQLGLV